MIPLGRDFCHLPSSPFHPVCIRNYRLAVNVTASTWGIFLEVWCCESKPGGALLSPGVQYLQECALFTRICNCALVSPEHVCDVQRKLTSVLWGHADFQPGPLTLRDTATSLKERHSYAVSWHVISVLVLCPVSICRNSFLPICRVNDFETADILYPSKWGSSTVFREPYQRMQLYTTATIACRPFLWPPEFPRALALDFLGPPLIPETTNLLSMTTIFWLLQNFIK